MLQLAPRGEGKEKTPEQKQAEAAFAWAQRCRGYANQRNTLAAAGKLMEAGDIDEFDPDPWLLNTPAGVVDLRTGEMREHESKYMCTKITSVAPRMNRPAPKWKQGQLQEQISLAAQQQTQTKNRLNKDYAAQLAAKVQELRQNQQNAFNQNYMTAVSAALGSQTKNDSTTTGSSNSLNLSGNIENMSDYAGGAGTSSGTKKKPSSKLPTVSLPDDVDVISHG